MTILTRRSGAAGAFLMALGAAGGAAAEQDLCAYGSGDPAIAACTCAIESGRLRGHDLAVRYSNRGIEWRLKHRTMRERSNIMAGQFASIPGTPTRIAAELLAR